ncbi:hypothetical protein E2C01_061308 [Portunus trituberculatus]|uniref:Uncharacterized protein n=1 Tax=Portunus trituberculatus TaxID=210409 RepID=A0A5B7H7S0_PORTR|nr:hypothetical protein [Portunus trituberculatus]
MPTPLKPSSIGDKPSRVLMRNTNSLLLTTSSQTCSKNHNVGTKVRVGPSSHLSSQVTVKRIQMSLLCLMN